jgi:hypothetical protein
MQSIESTFYGSNRQRVVRPPGLGGTCAVLLVLMAFSTVSEAGGHHWGHGGTYWRGPSVGVVVGVPLVGPYLAPGPYYGWPYTRPTPLVVEAPRTLYVERDLAPSQALTDLDAGGEWWYYCRKPKGYYPSVERCPSGWEKVPPTPD